MELALWTYEGPPHVGAMRVASAMRGVHLVLHSPQGDTYADLLFTMIERRDTRPPVTWTTFGARDLGGDTATLFQDAARDAAARFSPDLLLVGATCTASLIQDDPGGLARALGLPIPVIALELPAYQRKENWGAAETFYQLVRALARPDVERKPRSCNILGPTSLGFRHRDDIREIRDLLGRIGVEVNVVAPLGASIADLARLGAASFNISLYPEVSDVAASFLERRFGQKTVRAVPIGVAGTRDFIREVEALAGIGPVDIDRLADEAGLRLPWYAKSVDSHYLTGKRVFVFGDATHAVAAARVATAELGFTLVGLGTYSREQARAVREEAARHGLDALITEDTLAVEQAIDAVDPEIVLGTQMERHIAKRRAIACAVISAPVHVEDFPARFSPFMGFEGANVLFDTFVHPLMMGLEEHLLAMFRDDPEFGPDQAPSHLGTTARPVPIEADTVPPVATADDAVAWMPDAERELRRIPVFVRGRARRNTERYARERNLATISVETLYDAKAHYAR